MQFKWNQLFLLVAATSVFDVAFSAPGTSLFLEYLPCHTIDSLSLVARDVTSIETAVPVSKPTKHTQRSLQTLTNTLPTDYKRVR